MPTTTFTTRLVSDRQQRFIASLAAERVVAPAHQPLVESAANGSLASRVASQLIDALMNAPRVAAPAPTTARQDQGATDMPTPSQGTRAGRMLAAGSIEATVTLPDGRHVTVAIRTRTRSGRGWTNAHLGQDGARTSITILGNRVGWINLHGDQYRLTLRTRNAQLVAAVNAVLAYAAGQDTGALRVQEASRCGRCFRQLTDPVSIDRGIGPECFGRGTGSRHAQVHSGPITDAEAAADAAFAARERQQEEAAFASDPDYRAHQATAALNLAADALMTPVTTTTANTITLTPATSRRIVLDGDQGRARDLISEALDAYCSDVDRDFAMRIFDDLAAS